MRNSWLTLEKKAVLARSSSASASARRALVLVGAGIGEPGRDLARDQVDEAGIGGVERPVAG